MEILFGSPEATAVGVVKNNDIWQPVFSDSAPYSRYELEAWEGLEKGMMAFEEIMATFVANPLDSDGFAFVEDQLKRFLWNPSKDELERWGRFTHIEGWGRGKSMRLLPKELKREISLDVYYPFSAWKSAFSEVHIH
jgi:hypothetical protein